MKKAVFQLTFTAFLLSIVLLVLPLVSYAQPQQIHLGLGIKKSPSRPSPVLVTWFSAVSQGDEFLKYGVNEGKMKSVKASRTGFSGGSIFNGVMEDMKSGTRYVYKCGSDKDGWSGLYSFRSEPDTGTFRVAIIGDTQNSANNEGFMITSRIAGLVRIYSPSLTLHMGDLVENGSVTANWTGLLTATQDLNEISPLMPVLGNHDVQSNPGGNFQEPPQDYHLLFNLPGDEVNYSFTYRNVRFIGIYSGAADAAAKIDQVKFKPGSPESIWLDSELTKAENDRTINWIVVYMHYPVLSVGWSNVDKWRANIQPILERHKVDLCLAGHRHVYERYFQMKRGVMFKNDQTNILSTGYGTIYITNGTAGGNPTALGGTDLSSVAFTPDRTMYSFGIMDISDKSIAYSVYDQDNTLIDKFLIVK
ncbi:MAG: metallophosphoesterase family protein [Bacteroidota bacterium]|nr:metallophosphoesterase family protein [Bacteroidota bacterium]